MDVENVVLYSEIIDEQDIVVDKSMQELMNKCALTALELEGYSGDYELSITLVSDEDIHVLNREHRGVDKSTDVLSFPQWDEVPMSSDDMPVHIGDIVISVSTAVNQAKEYGHSLIREMAFLTTHSVFHLLGYDHEVEEDRLIMREKEEGVLEHLSIRRDY